jgi:hypothetical protein
LLCSAQYSRCAALSFSVISTPFPLLAVLALGGMLAAILPLLSPNVAACCCCCCCLGKRRRRGDGGCWRLSCLPVLVGCWCAIGVCQNLHRYELLPLPFPFALLGFLRIIARLHVMCASSSFLIGGDLHVCRDDSRAFFFPFHRLLRLSQPNPAHPAHSSRSQTCQGVRIDSIGLASALAGPIFDLYGVMPEGREKKGKASGGGIQPHICPIQCRASDFLHAYCRARAKRKRDAFDGCLFVCTNGRWMGACIGGQSNRDSVGTESWVVSCLLSGDGHLRPDWTRRGRWHSFNRSDLAFKSMGR